MPYLEQITLSMPKGTKDDLAKIKKESGLSKEDVFSLGFHYIAKKAEFERKAMEAEGKVPKTEEEAPSNIIIPDQFS